MSSFKKISDSYIEVDGELYEKIETKTETIELDLDKDIDEFVEKEFKKGGFVNRQEFIRNALRSFVSHSESEKQLLVEPVLHNEVDFDKNNMCKQNKCDCYCDKNKKKLLSE